MTIKVTKWEPDTCACIIEFSWDDSLSTNKREYRLHNIIRKCQRHSLLLNDNMIFETVLRENRAKNI